MEEEKPIKKNNNSLIAIIIAAVVVVVAAVVAVVLLLGGTKIKNIDDLKQAFKDKAAINCALSKDDVSYTFQSTAGWDKIHIFGNMDGEEVDMYLIKGDAIYASGNGMDLKMAYDTEYMDGFTDDIDSANSKEDASWGIDCKSASEANFNIPDKDWIDLSALQSAFGDQSDFDLDEDTTE